MNCGKTKVCIMMPFAKHRRYALAKMTLHWLKDIGYLVKNSPTRQTFNMQQTLSLYEPVFIAGLLYRIVCVTFCSSPPATKIGCGLICCNRTVSYFIINVRSELTWPVCSVSADLLRMFFDALYDEDVIKEEAFYKWESSKDPAEQTGKGVALKSVTAFFTWLREAEEESDKD